MKFIFNLIHPDFAKNNFSPHENTPADWLTIDGSSGVIQVSSASIGCDEPRRDTLDYTVRLYDDANESFGEVNNKYKMTSSSAH